MFNPEWTKARRLARELPQRKYKRAAKHRICQQLLKALASNAV